MPMWVEKILKYNPGEKSLKSSFAIYFGLECLLKKEHQNDNMKESYTEKKTNMNLLVGQCLRKINLMKKEKKLDYCRRKYCIKKLCDKVTKPAMKIINYEKKEMTPLTYEENMSYKEQETCNMCKEKLCMDKDDEKYKNKRKVKDHCHYRGKFRGAADSNRLNHKVSRDSLIIIHNASYDTHFIINQLAEEFKGKLNWIGKNIEKIYHFFCTN